MTKNSNNTNNNNKDHNLQGKALNNLILVKIIDPNQLMFNSNSNRIKLTSISTINNQ